MRQTLPLNEKVYLHLDRPNYISGDDIWFKAYLLNASTNKPTDNSATLYAELISPGAEIINRKVIHLANGAGHGDFKLADTLSPGDYRIRAYTQYMKNFGNTLLFDKQIHISQPQDAGSTTPNYKVQKTNIQFMPESGALIYGVECQLAFKAEYENGQSCDVSGRIVDENGSGICQFASSHLGMGKCAFTPQKDHKYTAEGTAGGKTFLRELKAPLESGFGLKVAQTDSFLNINIRCNELSLTEFEGEDMCLSFISRGRNIIKKTIEIIGTSTAVKLPLSNFPSGIIRIALTDNKQRPHCERMAFIENPEPTTLNVSMYPLANDSASITIKSNSKIPLNLSLAITDTSKVKNFTGNMQSYVWLESELRGAIERPAQYFDAANPRRKEQLDLLMLTQGWSNYLWRQLADSVYKLQYPAEKGLWIHGYAKKLWTKDHLENATVSMILMGAKNNGARGAAIDSTGLYDLGYIEFYGKKRIVISSKVNGEAEGEIKMDSLWMRKRNAPPIKISPKPFQAISEMELNELKSIKPNNKKKYTLKDTISLRPVVVKTPPRPRPKFEVFNTSPSDSAYADCNAYVMYNSAYPWTYRPIPDEIHPVDIVFGVYEGITFRPAVFIVNGRRLDNIDRHVVENLDFNDIQKIQITGRFISITSSQNIYFKDAWAFDKRLYHTINKRIQGYYEAKEFYKATTSFDKFKIDRSTIFWTPEITTNENGEAQLRFKLPVSNKAMRAIVEGFSPTGQIISLNTMLKN